MSNTLVDLAPDSLKIHHRFGPSLGHLWRTGPDISDTWQSLLWNIDINDEVTKSSDAFFRSFWQKNWIVWFPWKSWCIHPKLFRTVFKGILCKAQHAVGTIQTPSLSARWTEKIPFKTKFHLDYWIRLKIISYWLELIKCFLSQQGGWIRFLFDIELIEIIR